jgi:hypothetical protein
MTRFVSRLISTAAVLVFSAGITLAQPPKQQKFTGVVSDTMCGAKHMMQGSAADCTRACVSKGSKYALVVGDKVYTLSGHEQELDKEAGQRVTVTGTLDGDTINVNSVAGS